MAEQIIDLSFADNVIDPDPYRTQRLERYGERWQYDDSPLQAYHDWAYLPPQTGGLLGLLKKYVAYDADQACLDLGGGTNGVAARDLLELGFAGRALVTNFGIKSKREGGTRTHA